jgi:PelA/Pel-15E family pectate lyase
MRFLARAYQATSDEKDKDALLRAIHLLLAAQYATGGWPKGYPDFDEPCACRQRIREKSIPKSITEFTAGFTPGS